MTGMMSTPAYLGSIVLILAQIRIKRTFLLGCAASSAGAGLNDNNGNSSKFNTNFACMLAENPYCQIFNNFYAATNTFRPGSNRLPDAFSDCGFNLHMDSKYAARITRGWK